MFFALSKVLAFLITPLFWILLLLLLTLLAKNDRKRKRRLWWAFGLLLFFTNSFILDEVMRWWEVPAVHINELDKTYDAGIVLGFQITYDSQFDRVNFGRGTDRYLQAVELYRKGVIEKIVVSGGSGNLEYPDMKEAGLIKRFLLNAKIPESDIIIENRSRNTWENALYTDSVLQENFQPQADFLLITSAFHMRRAKSCFKEVGVEVRPYSADRLSGPRKFHWRHLFIPDAQALVHWNLLLHEWFGVVVYWLRGWV